ncbi:hypothetical protein BASA81_006706 [Batrachochytrium salamandrivorans]|nr:hypothetical protein BASA81_006706 [Batrachochytrium salamandrivorans]
MSLRTLVLLSLLVLAGLVLQNSNSTEGDEFRHRPLWIKSLDFLPKFELKSSWLLRGDEPSEVREGLEVLLDDLNTNAQLTSMGRVIAFTMLRDQLVHRQCVLKPVPGRRGVDSGNPLPVVIVGLPRTGTSFLHQLLAKDEANFRAPKFHEYMDACPTVAQPGTVAGELRILYQNAKLAVFRLLVPKLKSVHYMSATTLEEDLVPLGQVMAWLLKTPWHLFQLEELTRVLHPRKMVWTHRDPVQQCASLVSTVVNLVGSNSDQVRSPETRQQLARETVDFWFLGLERAVKARLALPRTLFVDVEMEELRADPVAVVKRLYRELGLEFQPELFARAAKEINASSFGKHEYPPLSAVGLDETAVRQRYDEIMRPLNSL